MATESTPPLSPTQRHYRAPCPGCGAPVEFQSAQSTHAVCGYCQSTVVRSGKVLSRIGKMSELFDDHSPLQLRASGSVTLDGSAHAFTLIGRLQYKSAAGTWTEWVASLDDGRLASLGEDNGAYVFTHAMNPGRALPEAARFRVGAQTAINGTLQGSAWQVAGFQHRMGQDTSQSDDEIEQFGWSEYLLYHQQRGFAFLVDAEDG